MEGLTKVEWKDIQVALLSVPIRHRTKAWKKASDFVNTVISKPNALAIPLSPDGFHYVPECDLCHKPISLDEDHVHKALTSTYRHYDCFHLAPPESGSA
jgi:hypothetical protein